MAGKIIVSTLQSDTDNSISFVANTGATIFSANLSHGIAGSFIADGTITAAKIADGAIVATEVADGAITGPKLGANAINANNIVNGTITTTQIASNTISNTNIATGAIENYSRATGLLSGMRNRIINGAMVIDQRNAGASVSTSSNSSAYTVDRWQIQYSQTSKFTIQQNAGSVTPPTGFTNYLGVTSSSAYSVVSSDYFGVIQSIEGYNIADLDWGTANAKTVTLSFWVRSSLTGTFGGSLRNQPNFTYAYPFTYTISSANTWEYKTITITGATSGTWGSTNGAGIQLIFGIGVGSSNSGTPNAWASSSSFGATGATSVVGTNGATFYITGVQLEVGSTATSFDYRPYGTELQLCQRYFETFTASSLGLYLTNGFSGSFRYGNVFWKVEKRATPTATAAGSGGTPTITPEGTTGARVTAPANGSGDNVITSYTASAEL